MRIALAQANLPNEAKGGVAHHVHDMGNALTERGHDVTVFTFSPRFDDCRYAVHTFPNPPRIKNFLPIAQGRALARTDFSAFDVINAHGDSQWIPKGKYPLVRTMNGSAKDEALSAVSLQRKLFQNLLYEWETASTRNATVNVGISDATVRRYPDAAMRVIPCGVNIARFHPGTKSAHPTVLFVGTTGGRKRGQLLVDAFNSVIRPALPTAELWSVAEAPMSGDGVVNMGRVSPERITELFREAWVFCLPSSYEGFGIPYIEAMASGTAAVATPNPGAVEVLANGEYGLLADEARLGAELLGLLTDGTRRGILEAKGLARAKRYAWDTIVAEYLATFEDAIALHRRGA